MSKSHSCDNRSGVNNIYTPMPVCGGGSGICSFPTLVILILIILQFNNKRRSSGGKRGLVDNSILFIIALFYLSCCNPGKRIGY